MNAGEKKLLWREDEVAQLRQLLARGTSVSDIARVLGRTRNAVIGRVHRMGLHMSPLAVTRARSEGGKMRRRGKNNNPSGMTAVRLSDARTKGKAKAGAPPMDTAPIPPAEALPSPRSIADIAHRQCRWIGARPDLLTLDTPIFCGAPTDGGSWCAVHRARVLVGRPVRTA